VALIEDQGTTAVSPRQLSPRAIVGVWAAAALPMAAAAWIVAPAMEDSLGELG
jgi:hypothetical protein